MGPVCRAPALDAGRRRPSVPAAVFAAVLCVVVAAAGCSAPGPQLAWSPVRLPGDAAPVTLTAYQDELLVGTFATSGGAGPGLARVRGDTVTALPVTPASGYGAEARWLSLAVDAAGAVVAVGGARGGAHANVRWSVWRGSTSTGLIEAPQTFETFGGWGAGDLVGAVAPPTGPLLVGSWESRRAGLDAAVWTSTGPATWTRQPSADTALESTEQELVGVVSAALDGSRVVLAGSVLRLGDGSVRRSPAVWRSQTGSAGWSRLDLPARGAGESAGAACAGGVCTVVGRVDGQVAVWRLTDAAHRLGTVPAVAVADDDPLPPPALTGSGAVLAVPDGAGSRLLRESDDGWASLPGPPGRVTALTAVATVVYAVAADPGGANRLWAAHL